MIVVLKSPEISKQSQFQTIFFRSNQIGSNDILDAIICVAQQVRPHLAIVRNLLC